MARAAGYTCDVCGKFGTTTDDRNPPIHWMIVTVVVDAKITVNASINTSFHICSDRCLRSLGASRMKGDAVMSNGTAETPRAPVTSTGKEYTDEARAVFKQNGLKMQHKKGNHGVTAGTEPHAECELCLEEMTTPSQ